MSHTSSQKPAGTGNLDHLASFEVNRQPHRTVWRHDPCEFHTSESVSNVAERKCKDLFTNVDLLVKACYPHRNNTIDGIERQYYQLDKVSFAVLNVKAIMYQIIAQNTRTAAELCQLKQGRLGDINFGACEEVELISSDVDSKATAFVNACRPSHKNSIESLLAQCHGLDAVHEVVDQIKAYVHNLIVLRRGLAAKVFDVKRRRIDDSVF